MSVIPMHTESSSAAGSAGAVVQARVMAVNAGEATWISMGESGTEHAVVSHLEAVPALCEGDWICAFVASGGAIIAGRLRIPGDGPAAIVRESAGHLELNAERSITLRTGQCCIEISAEGLVRIDGHEIQQIAEQRLGLMAARLELN